MVGIANDNVVEDFDLEKLSRSNEVTSDFDVRFGRSWLAARMIVLCEVTSYVQCPIAGADITTNSTTKGVLWMPMNHSVEVNLTTLFGL